MDKWKKLKGFLTDGKEHITKDVYVSRPSVFEEILDIMEELEKRELSEKMRNRMTVEEAKEFIAQSVKSDVDMALVADAIKALEQEPILEKIKAETIIDELEKIKAEITEYRRKNNCGVMECLDIIDKEIKGAWRSKWR